MAEDDALHAVATDHAFPSNPIAATRRSAGNPFASCGRISESGESGMPSSPTAVFSSNRPAMFESESSVAAVTLPVSFDTRLKLTIAESPGGMLSIDFVASPLRLAPLMFCGCRLTVTKFAGDCDVLVTVTSSV